MNILGEMDIPVGQVVLTKDHAQYVSEGESFYLFLILRAKTIWNVRTMLMRFISL